MILKINDDYRITTDSMNIMLEKKKVIENNTKTHKIGDVVWNIIGYYSEFEHAYNAAIKHGILTSDLKGLRAIINKIDIITQEVRKSLSTVTTDVADKPKKKRRTKREMGK